MTLNDILSTNDGSTNQLVKLLASQYVRRDNRFYHIDRPTEAISRRDVEQTFMHVARRELPDIELTPDLLKAVFRVGIELQHNETALSIPVWGGEIRSVPGSSARLTWNNNGTVSLNCWILPEYRQLGVNEARYGRFGPLFRKLFPRPRERKMILDWVAWTLQNETNRPAWALLLYSKQKGTGKSTFCDVLKHLYGVQNSTAQNNVDSLVTRFNTQVLLSKLVICEELALRSLSKQSNTLKTFITDREVLSERKGREAELLPLVSCFVFTTNHLPTWLEPGERRYFIVQTDHDGFSSGPKAAEFGNIVAEVYDALDKPEEVASLYNALIDRQISEYFNPKSLNTELQGTAVMKQLLGTSGETVLDQLEEYLGSQARDVITQAKVKSYVVKELRQNGNRTRHMMQELGWTQHKLKWGGVDYARVIWAREDRHIADGNIIHPDGKVEAICDYLALETWE